MHNKKEHASDPNHAPARPRVVASQHVKRIFVVDAEGQASILVPTKRPFVSALAGMANPKLKVPRP